MLYLILRNPDPTKPYILDTNASKYAIGAVLSQDYPDGRHPITYFSKSLLDAKTNYGIYDQELLAIIKAVTAFRYLFLEAQEPFIIRTNHKNLKYFKSLPKISTQQVRWHKFLQDYNFKLEHFPGKSNMIADLLSRRKDFEGGVNPNKSITILPDYLFMCKIYLEDDPET
jgi:RNase H-like domain found in reverse transcriptase